MEILTLEQLTHDNYRQALAINRDDIPEAWVDTASALMEVTDYGAAHHLIGHTYLACIDGCPVGLIMIGEALAWETDPEEMKDKPFYRVMGFVVDKNHRNRGIGGEILENAIAQVYRSLGNDPLRWGFTKTMCVPADFMSAMAFNGPASMKAMMSIISE